MTPKQPRHARPGTLAIALMAALSACTEPPDTLRTVATLPLPDSAASSLSIDGSGSMWVSVPGAILRVAGEPPAVRRFDVRLTSSLRWLGDAAGGPVFTSDEALAAIDLAGDSVRVFEDGSDAAVLDVLGHWIFRTREMGEMIAHDPVTLAPLWGWAEVGAESPALALSPEADRVYQSAGEMEFRDSPELLARDLQTGRVMYRREMPATVRALVAGPDGRRLWGSMGDGAGGDLFALEWTGGELEIVWKTSVASLDLEAPLGVKLSPDGRWLLVVGGNENGLRILDAEAGEVVDRLRGDIRDAAFAPDGTLFLLYTDRVERVVGRISGRGQPYP